MGVAAPIGRIDAVRGEIRQAVDGYGWADIPVFRTAERGGEGPYGGYPLAGIVAGDKLRGGLLQFDEVGESQVVFEGERVGRVPEIAGDQPCQQSELAGDSKRPFVDG